jgi:hypothetical protein
MVHVELRTPIYDPTSGTLRWETLTSLRVDDGHSPELDGDLGLLDFDMPIVSLRSGATIHFADDPEEWARSLVLAYRAGDLVATVLHDDHPVTEDDVVHAADHRHGAAAV